jgi:hypothetical protein
MENWIPFGEGEYWIERACLFSPAQKAAMLKEAILEIYRGRDGRLHMKGSGKIKNILIVELLEDYDDLHLLVDLGSEFKYKMETPELHAGKVFSPDIKAMLRFVPNSPWEQLPEQDFENLLSGLEFLH